MRFDVEIQIRGEKILINSPQKSYHLEQKNLIAFDRDNKIVAIGQSQDELIIETPQYEDVLRNEIRFEPLYTENDMGLEKLFVFMVYELTRISSGEMILARLLRINSPTCYFVLPNYEKIDKEARKQFEYLLFQEGVEQVYINGISRGWNKLQRTIIKLSNFVVVPLWLLLWYLFNSIITQYNISWDVALVILTSGISLFIIYYFLTLIRILILRTFLPHDLLRLDLLSQRKDTKSVWTRFLTSLLDKE